jgi:CheY-like chemotaxis protein
MPDADDSQPAVDARPYVAVIDDNQMLLKTYEQIFQSTKQLREYRFAPFSSAEAALRMLNGLQAKEQQPSLFLLDWGLKGMSGVDFLDCLRTDARWKNIPVIMATAKGNPGSVALAVAKGASAFLVKPIKTKVLIEKIAKALQPVAVADGSPISIQRAPLP